LSNVVLQDVRELIVDLTLIELLRMLDDLFRQVDLVESFQLVQQVFAPLQ
jgi:hypothetical protein